MIGAKQARERGLRWSRTLRAEALQHPSREFWVVNELVEYDSGEQGWRYSRDRFSRGRGSIARYATEAAAAAAARVANEVIERTESERLKQDKAALRRGRLLSEEVLMRAAAIARHKDSPRVPPEHILVAGGRPDHLERVVAATRAMPYLRRVYCTGVWPPRIYLSADGAIWEPDAEGKQKPWARPSARASEFARRAQIAEGFGFNAEANWGATKAAIRKILKPRANELLELASVRRLLDEAIRDGKRAFLWGDVVFWYEEEALRWDVKRIGRAKDAQRGDSLWLEGTIVSKNHGRIIVLPYRKQDGSMVQGHTRNAPGDEPARPRHPSQYVEIPFSKLDGDLMAGLHGELPYE
ncbi:hypothetical protein [Roseomonas chloroacetimidivorans]|uniref:hypothetical protein n=1 Tax=Roseomonas chloroacetimidivorans TaxID=1766656 RepID=UPI003C72EBE6